MVKIAQSRRETPRKHGPSRLERLLEQSIRHETRIRALYRLLLTVSARLAKVERR